MYHGTICTQNKTIFLSFRSFSFSLSSSSSSFTMAPLVPPPPVIDLEAAKAIEKKLESMPEEKAILRKHGSTARGTLTALFTGDKVNDAKKFSGKAFVDWAIEVKISPDAEHATKVGQALLEHRLAHHVTDDADFENSPDQFYSFISRETIEKKMFHSALGQFIAKPDIFHQGNLELKAKSLFGSEKWIPVFAVLDDPSASPRMLHLFKRASAASPPIESYAVEECMCSLEECMDCKTDWYCFTLKAKKRATGKDSTIVMCANHSKRLEGWLSALMEAGVEFTKEEEGADLSKVKSIFELSARRLNTQEMVPLSQFQGKVCLVVNVASK